MKRTIIIEDADKFSYITRLEGELNRLDGQIVNIDTGVVHNNYDSNGRPMMYYYAIIIVEENTHED